MCRWENAPTTRELVRLTGALVDIYCASYPAPPAAVTLDIDNTVDVVHGAQQLSFWNGHLICPLLSGPKSLLFWIMKEFGNGQKAQS
jgi:hypothetical protein